MLSILFLIYGVLTCHITWISQQKKREMVASAFGEDENGSRQTRLTVEDLRYLFMDE